MEDQGGRPEIVRREGKRKEVEKKGSNWEFIQ